MNLAFLDTRYIIKIFIHALLVKKSMNKDFKNDEIVLPAT